MEAKSFEGKHNFKDKPYKEGMVDDDLEYETEEEEVGGGGHGGSNACNALGYFENEKRKEGQQFPAVEGPVGASLRRVAKRTTVQQI